MANGITRVWEGGARFIVSLLIVTIFLVGGVA